MMMWWRHTHSPSKSTSLIMSCSSASVGFWPSDRMTIPSSLDEIWPSPFLSNNENASLNSVNRSYVSTSWRTSQRQERYRRDWYWGVLISVKITFDELTFHLFFFNVYLPPAFDMLTFCFSMLTFHLFLKAYLPPVFYCLPSTCSLVNSSFLPLLCTDINIQTQ